MARNENYLICIFMNINENLKNMRNNKNTINKLISAPTTIKLPLLHVFKASEIQFDKPFHLMVLYENNFICIFMNINENLKNEEKIIGKTSTQGINN